MIKWNVKTIKSCNNVIISKPSNIKFQLGLRMAEVSIVVSGLGGGSTNTLEAWET